MSTAEKRISTAEQKKSSVRSRKSERLAPLSFAPIQEFRSVNRDYGMIRVTKLAGTPFPRPSEGVNVEVLKDRLDQAQEQKLLGEQESMNDNDSDSLHRDYNIHFHLSGKEMKESMRHKLLSTGTPHPHKGQAVDPRSLFKMLDKYDGNYKTKKFAKGIEPEKKLKTSVKGIFDNKSELVRKKRVTIIIPKHTLKTFRVHDERSIDSFASFNEINGLCTFNSRNMLTFYERRKLFCEAEFTIAKNGRKLSEMMMPIPPQGITIEDKVNGSDEQANEAFDLFIKAQGFVKAHSGTITCLRSNPSESRITEHHSTISSIVRPQTTARSRLHHNESDIRISGHHSTMSYLTKHPYGGRTRLRNSGSNARSIGRNSITKHPYGPRTRSSESDARSIGRYSNTNYQSLPRTRLRSSESDPRHTPRHSTLSSILSKKISSIRNSSKYSIAQ